MSSLFVRWTPTATHGATASAPLLETALLAEGGGALALAWTDTLLIQEHAVFSVMAPEGAAVILARDATRAPEVAEGLALTSDRLCELGVVDAVIPDATNAAATAIAAALAEVPVGRRRQRPDAVTAAALRE